MATEALLPHIHHERQEQGSMLCAQHALNALLQGNYYDPSQLAEIAKQLDGLEQSQLDEESWRNRDTASLNMDDTGFFSVSVLEKALEVWGLSLLRWRSEGMRVFQSKPEEQLAFVLNLDSHWFTIRSFLGGYWFNLNSFLDKPSWVGPSYLGALLDAAETEGYSVFVVRAAEDSKGVFQSSVADECAATLPPASVAGGMGAVQGQGSTAQTQGLRPSLTATTSSSTGFGIHHSGQESEDADLQAALRASMAGADLGGSGVAGAAGGSTSSRMQSPIVAGQRRFRGSGEEDSLEEEEETDAHVDAIAPSRRRVRGLGPGEGTNLVTSRGVGVPYVLPTASGGRRRTSRLQADDEERYLSRRRQRAMRGTSGSHQHPISIEDDDDDEHGEGDEDETRRLGLGEIDDDGDDFEELNMASSAPRSPFLNPALMVNSGGASGNNSDDDFHSISSGEANLDESWAAEDATTLQRGARIQDRSYDDEDAQLQAALAASMREAEGTTSTSASTTADWISEEDSKAIREAQMATWTTMARQESDQGPTPADVEKIARMRAEAKKKAEEERMGIKRDDESVEAGGDADGQGKQKEAESEEEEESDEEGAPQMTAEEMRRARLARFGGP